MKGEDEMDWEKWDQPSWPILIGLIAAMTPVVGLLAWGLLSLLPAGGCS
jgi:hypothetical protein